MFAFKINLLCTFYPMPSSFISNSNLLKNARLNLQNMTANHICHHMQIQSIKLKPSRLALRFDVVKHPVV